MTTQNNPTPSIEERAKEHVNRAFSNIQVNEKTPKTLALFNLTKEAIEEAYKAGFIAGSSQGSEEWIDMDSAPKDGTFILISDEEKNIHKASWSTDADVTGRGPKAWCIADTYQDEQGGFYTIDNPKKWRPMPKPPIN